MSRRWEIPRRAFLTAAGGLLALPLLEQMERSFARAATPTVGNLIVWHFPTSWTPTAGARVADNAVSGKISAATLGPVFAPLAQANLLNDLTLVTNVTNPGAYDNLAGDHARGTGALLTCMRPLPGQLNVGPSMDIVASQTLGKGKQVSALQIGTSGPVDCDAGVYPYPDCYATSWADVGQPLPGESDPQKAWNTLFANFVPGPSATAKKQLLYRRSILDYSLAESARLKARLNPRDAAKVDQLETNIRDYETRLKNAAPVNQCTVGQSPTGTPPDIRDHIGLMTGLTVLGLQCGVTPVVTFSYENTVSERQHTFLNTADGRQVVDGWHIGITHHNNDPFKIAEQQAVNTWLVAQFAELAVQLKKVALPNGTSLLDNTIMLGVSDMGDQAHNHSNMIPIMLGGSALGVKTGQIFVNANPVNLANVHLGVLRALNCPVTSFGDSTGALPIT